LTVRARAEGFLARIRYGFSTPVLTVDGEHTDLSWLGERRLAVAPGEHEIGVHFRNRRSTHGHATTRVVLAPGAVADVDAVLERGSFRLSVTP
jgi:hypothetical protein